MSGEPQETVNEKSSCLSVKPGPAWHILLTDPVEVFTTPLEWLIET